MVSRWVANYLFFYLQTFPPTPWNKLVEISKSIDLDGAALCTKEAVRPLSIHVISKARSHNGPGECSPCFQLAWPGSPLSLSRFFPSGELPVALPVDPAAASGAAEFWERRAHRVLVERRSHQRPFRSDQHTGAAILRAVPVLRKLQNVPGRTFGFFHSQTFSNAFGLLDSRGNQPWCNVTDSNDNMEPSLCHVSVHEADVASVRMSCSRVKNMKFIQHNPITEHWLVYDVCSGSRGLGSFSLALLLCAVDMSIFVKVGCHTPFRPCVANARF